MREGGGSSSVSLNQRMPLLRRETLELSSFTTGWEDLSDSAMFGCCSLNGAATSYVQISDCCWERVKILAARLQVARGGMTQQLASPLRLR
jgi:hypothetical protein